MAPIYESDVAEKRWSESEWNHYEFWERVELRLKRNQRLWIAAAVIVFLGISSIPVVIDQRPRWASLAMSRYLAQELNRMKREASLEHSAFRIRFLGNGSLDYVVEKSESCQSSTVLKVREKSLLSRTAPLLSQDANQAAPAFALLSSENGDSAGVPGLVTEFCYDPLQGSYPFVVGKPQIGFGIAPAHDLSAGRFDRLSVLLVSGASAELSFD